MNVMNYTRRVESWQAKLSAGTQEEVFDRILKTLCSNKFYEVNSELSHEEILQALIQRETQRSTFDASISLKLMAQLSRMLMDSTVRAEVLAAKDTESLRNIVKEHNPRIDKTIEARDIMRPPTFSIRDDEPVSKCTHTMSVNTLHAIPVVNARQQILGEITVDRLFKYGLPEFFSKLKSVSFIAEFDPFEKYFQDERHILARDMMGTPALTVPPNYTIMEIVFDLAIRNNTQLYVIDEDGRWIGTIDKGVVLDNVINY
jgi:CBS-domain-containing membrane protein